MAQDQKIAKTPFDKLKQSLLSKDLSGSIQVSKGERITDIKRFVTSHIKFLESNPGNKTFMPYWDRLVQLNKLL